MSFLKEMELNCDFTFFFKEKEQMQEAVTELAKHEKKLAFVNFVTNYQTSFAFVVESRFGGNNQTRNTKIILIGSMEEHYPDVNNLEGAVDGFVTSPINKNNFIQSLNNFFLDLLRPSTYPTLIEISQKLTDEEKFEVAEALLTKAKSYHPRPALALYYQGRSHENKQELDSAFKSYVQALKFNKNHYMTLQGLFGVLVHLKRPNDAMKVLSKMLTIFPTPESIISTFIDFFPLSEKLSIILLLESNFSTILNEKNEDAIKYVFTNSCRKSAEEFFSNNMES